MSRRQARRGIVLLDVVLALAVILLLALILVPVPRAQTGAVELRAEGARIASTFRKARAGAIRDGAPRDVLVDAFRRSVGLPGETPITLPGDVEMTWITSSLCPVRSGLQALRFLADGRSCGGVLTLASADNELQLKVDWLTGRVEMSMP
jgi:general secretion pathway protein H